MAVRIVRLGTPRAPDEGLRIGTVRHPPRGVPKAEFASHNWYDVWYPLLSPSSETVKLALKAATPAQWAAFVKRYRAEMAKPDARHAIDCLVTLQARGGGDALIGRALYPMLVSAGLLDVVVEPLVVYADASRPAMVEGFTLATFTAMVEGVTDAALQAGLTDEARWARGIAALRRAAAPDGTFSYTFFRGVGTRA